MNRRMIAAALACLACTAGLSACSLTGTGDTHHIAVIIKHAGEHFQNVMAGAEACASEHPNVTIDIQFPSLADDSAEQLDLFRSALDDDSVDAVVISPMQSGQLSAAAESTDKPIIALDTDFTSDKKLSFVGTGNEAAAKSGGLAAMKKAKSNGADKPQAVILTGAQGDETHEARLRGYRSAVEQAGGTVLEGQYCDAQPDRAAAAMEAVMQEYPQGVDALLVTSDDMALAAIKCIWDNNSAAYQKTVICGFDGNQAAVEALDRGVVATHVRGRQRVGDRRGLEPHRVHHQHDGQHDDGKDNGKHDHEDSPFDKHMPTIIAAPPSESPQVAISAAEKRMVLLVPSACNGTKAPLRYPPINQGTEITGQCGQDTLVPVLSYFI